VPQPIASEHSNTVTIAIVIALGVFLLAAISKRGFTGM
jgi:hypothetical protein